MKKALAFFLVGLLLTGCRGYVGEIGLRAPESFPQRDIVFQRATVSGEDGRGLSLGFVNADGSGLVVMEFHAILTYGWAVMAYPAWSSDGSVVVFRANEPVGEGVLMVAHAGEEILRCPDKNFWGSGRAYFLGGNEQAITKVGTGIDNLAQIALIDLGNCRVIRTYLVEKSEEETLETPDITQDGRWLTSRWVISRWPPEWAIVIIDLTSDTQTVIGKGCCPSWSPDGRWLAYTGEVYGMRKGDYINTIYAEGIYVVARDGSQKKKVASCHFANCDDWIAWPPAPSWSPDGQWLVYHRCMVSPCTHGTEAANYSIFKVNVETGEEVKIVDGGLNPYWRWAEP